MLLMNMLSGLIKFQKLLYEDFKIGKKNNYVTCKQQRAALKTRIIIFVCIIWCLLEQQEFFNSFYCSQYNEYNSVS